MNDGSSQPFSKSIVDAFQTGSPNIIVQDGAIGRLNSDGDFDPSSLTDWRFNRVDRLPQRGFVATGMTSAQDWHLIGMSPELEYRWSIPLGSQFFQNQLHPISVCRIDHQMVCAVADSEGRISFVSEQGTWMGEFLVRGELRGLQLTTREGQPHLIVASGKRVQGFDLTFVRNPMQPASSR